MNVSCKRSSLGKLLSTFAVLAVFVFSGLTTDLHAQQEHATTASYWHNVEFIDADQAAPILAAFVDNLSTQLSTSDETNPDYYKMYDQHVFATHVWEDCTLNIDVATSITDRYTLISEQASGTATNASKANPGSNAANSFNPALMEVVNLLKK